MSRLLDKKHLTQTIMFNIPALTEQDTKPKSFVPLAADKYLLTVKEVVLGEAEVKKWEGMVSIPTGEKEPQWRIVFNVTSLTGETKLLCDDGTEVENPTTSVFLVMKDIFPGWNTKDNKPKMGREVLTALLGVDVKGPINISEPDSLVGLQITAFLAVENKKDGTKKNTIVNPKKK